MITQYINTTVNGAALKQDAIVARVNFSLNGCASNSSCQKSFYLLLLETSGVDTSNSLNVTGYVTFPASKITIAQIITGSVTQIQDIPIPLSGKGGIYLGVQDIGACVTINRLTVFYFVCPEQTSNLTNYPVAVPNGPTIQLLCISGASAVGQRPPQASCGGLGIWGAVTGSCRCNPGYTQVNQTCKCRLNSTSQSY